MKTRLRRLAEIVAATALAPLALILLLTGSARAQSAPSITLSKSATSTFTIDVEGFDVQDTVNVAFTLTGTQTNGQPVWESATHTIEYGVISADHWEILLKPGAFGAGRPGLCDTGGNPGAGPHDCANWREWRGSGPGFVSVPVTMSPTANGPQDALDVSGFEVQSVVNGPYTLTGGQTNGQPVWESATHTIEYGVIGANNWEILLKPGEFGAGRPGLCDTGGDPGAGPFDCADWREWRGSGPGFVSVDAAFLQIDALVPADVFDVSGFVVQDTSNGLYTVAALQTHLEPTWESDIRTLELGEISPDHWEFLSKPSAPGPGRPGLCDSGGGGGGLPFECGDWREWRGSGPGFVSVPLAFTSPVETIYQYTLTNTSGGLEVSGFDVQSVVNGPYTLTGQLTNGQPVWESATHTIEYGVIGANNWEILLKPGEFGAGRPGLCDTGGSPGAGPFDCADWREWRGSGPGFVSIPAVFDQPVAPASWSVLDLTDDAGTPLDPSDDVDVLASASFLGTDDGNGLLDPGESWTWELGAFLATAAEGTLLVNEAVFTAQLVTGGPSVMGSDRAGVLYVPEAGLVSSLVAGVMGLLAMRRLPRRRRRGRVMTSLLAP